MGLAWLAWLAAFHERMTWDSDEQLDDSNGIWCGDILLLLTMKMSMIEKENTIIKGGQKSMGKPIRQKLALIFLNMEPAWEVILNP